MADFIVDLFSTLDGFGTGPVGYWAKEGPELVADRARAFGDPDQTLVFGREHLPADAALPRGEPGLGFVAAQQGAEDRDLTHAQGTANLDELDARHGDALEVVPRLKAESPAPLRCHGSVRMNRALLAAGLVDRLELMVFPVITGESGRNPVLAGLPDIDLELVDSRTFDGRVQQLLYIPRGPWRH